MRPLWPVLARQDRVCRVAPAFVICGGGGACEALSAKRAPRMASLDVCYLPYAVGLRVCADHGPYSLRTAYFHILSGFLIRAQVRSVFSLCLRHLSDSCQF